MNTFRADLHCHTTCSDGSVSPQEIVHLAKQMGLQGLSITDHDTIEAYKSAISVAGSLGIALIPGIEFSAMQDNVSVHILGYSFVLDHPSILQLCEGHKVRRLKRNRIILELLSKNKMPITEQEVLDSLGDDIISVVHTIGRPHIAQAMVKKGYVATVQDAFKEYIGEGRICYASGDSFSVDDTLATIHAAGGLAVVAHPHLMKSDRIINKLMEKPFDGIECYYARLPANQHARWIKLAQKKGLLMTGGSDFHGSIKPNIPLGASWVGEEPFTTLQRHYESHF